MKKEKLQIISEHKESLNRYDLKFIWKNKLQLYFILPEEEKDYYEKLKTDKVIKTILRLYYLFYRIFGKSMFNYMAREKGVDFLLEDSNGIHKGDVYIEIVE